MFILKSLHIENFMSINSADFEFSNNQMTAITGNNGAGKTALFSAIAFALTGYRKGESIKNYVKAGSELAKIYLKADFLGELIIYDIEIYNNSKHPQPTNKKIEFRGKTYLNSDCNLFAKEFKLEELENLMFMFQNSNEIIEAKPAERATILKKLFKFEFPDIVETLKNKQEEQNQESIGHNAVLNELNSRSFDRLPLMRETAPVAISAWEDRLKEINSSLALIGDTNEDEINKVESDLEFSQKSLVSLQTNLNTSIKSKEKLESQNRDIDNFLGKYDSKELQADLDKIKLDISKHESEYSDKRDCFNKLNEELSILQYSNKELNKQYEISKTGICHACGQPIEKEHIDKLEKELKSSSESIALKEKEIKDLAFDKRDLKGIELNKALAEKEDILKKYNNEVKTKETNLTRISDLTTIITEREKTQKDLELKIDLLTSKKEKLSKMIGLIAEKNNLLNEENDIKGKLQTARDNHIKNIERKSSNEKIAKNEEERNNRVKSINEKINALNRDIDKIKKELDIFENKFPNFIVLQACQKIEDIVNSIVQRIFPYCRVSLKLSRSGVNFFYLTEESDEEWIPVSMACGAQAKIISIAYFVALAKLSGVTCIFLDEIDASMTAENASVVYEFIAGLNFFDQVFFISHRPEAHKAVREINDKLVTYLIENGTYTEI